MVLMIRSCVTIGSREISLLFALGSSSGCVVVMVFQALSTLNLKRMSCKACLFAGKLSINDTDDIDDREVMDKGALTRLMIETLGFILSRRHSIPSKQHIR